MRRRARLADDGGVYPAAGDEAGLDDTITLLIQLGRDREAAALGSERLAQPTRGVLMHPTTQLDQIVPLLTGLVASVQADDLGRPTPCAGFDVRQVLEHMVGGATMFAAAFRGTEPSVGGLPSDIVGAFPGAMESLRDAVHAPGALDRTIDAPFGEVPGEAFARFVALDGLVHAWDIAVATGQRYEPPTDLVAAVDAFARQAINEGMRDGDTFAMATEPPSGATPIERIVAFTGRTVG